MMARNQAPVTPRENIALVDPKSGLPTAAGLQAILQTWRQVVAGFVIVPCTASEVDNEIALTPRLHQEGGFSLGDGMTFAFEGPATSDGAVTIALAEFDALKAYIDDGASQAGVGDVVDGSIYLAVYWTSLDSGSGGFVLK